MLAERPVYTTGVQSDGSAVGATLHSTMSTGGDQSMMAGGRPQRRRGDGAGAASPPAKRPPSRPQFVEPVAAIMSHENLVLAFTRLEARYTQDVVWHEEVAAAVVQHAERLDTSTGFHKTTLQELIGLKHELDVAKLTIEENDQGLKDTLKANDELIKNGLENVDQRVAEATAGLTAVSDNAISEINRLRSELDAAAAGTLAGRCVTIEGTMEALGSLVASLASEIEVGHTKLGQEILSTN